MSNEHIKALRGNDAHGESGENTGCIFRCSRDGHNHRKNGFNYAKANLKSSYNIDFSKGVEKKRFDACFPNLFYRSKKRDPRVANSNVVYLGEGSYSHINWATGFSPVRNQAHHILPVNSIQSFLSKEQGGYLLQAKYNINKGLNIIILPCDVEEAKAWEMLTHCGSHPTYNREVKVQIENLKKLRNEANEREGHRPLRKQDMSKLKKDLEEWSEDQMEEILEEGKRNPGGKINACPTRPATLAK
ncbi:MAG: AHH domain-containing protein [Gammaproteobacteria bacterium]|nr:AHH domain-containing protein [Gammaproteobacteria bacterium]